MDKLKQYQNILQNFFQERAAIQNRQASGLKAHLIINGEQTDFALLKMGWKAGRYVHTVAFHIAIKDEKIWIYSDKIDIDVAAILTKAGVAKVDIVLAFLSPKLREISDYAVA